MTKIAVVGAGAWGTALAAVWRRKGHDVAMWSRRAPDPAAFAGSDAIVIAVPTQDVRAVLAQVTLPAGVHLVLTAKGIERATGKFLDQIAAEAAPAHPALLLSGPSFAADVLAGRPTAVTLAGEKLSEAMAWADILSLPAFRIYASDDVRGVALGGALKNVLAIACGISDGEGLGDSARAALITRGFAELSRLGARLGARTETLFGLSGLGDLVLTASSATSRNYSFGRALGEGRGVAEAMALSKGTVEGAFTAAIAADLARRLAVAMPITQAVHAIIDQGSPHKTEIARLLSRPISVETN